MDRLKIKWKMAILAALAALGFTLLISSNYFVVRSLSTLNNISLQGSQLESQMLMLRRHEKDFLARKNSKYLAKFEQSFTALTINLTALEINLKASKISVTEITKLRTVLNQYHDKFIELSQQQKRIGFHPKDGLYGLLRAEVHKVEAFITEIEAQQNSSFTSHSLMRTILMLRRHEKDFMLRRDMKYVDKFNQRMRVMNTKLALAKDSDTYPEEIKVAIQNYADKFLRLVTQEQQLGLNSSQGVLGEMRTTIHQSETLLNEFHLFITERTNHYIAKEKQQNIAIGLGLIILILAVFTYISNGISTRISYLSKIMAQAETSKDLSIRANLTGQDELSTMANVYNQMMQEFDLLMTEVRFSSIELEKPLVA